MAKRTISDVRAAMGRYGVTQQELATYLGYNRSIVGAVITREDDVADRWYEAVEAVAKSR